jgi:hypothetical protein
MRDSPRRRPEREKRTLLRRNDNEKTTKRMKKGYGNRSLLFEN